MNIGQNGQDDAPGAENGAKNDAFSVDSGSRRDSLGARPNRPPLLIVLACLLFAEGAALAAAAAWLLVELLTEQPASYLSAVALFALTVLAAAWLLLTAAYTLRAKPWIRAAALTWQILQAAVAFASFQGLEIVPGIGWVLLAASILGVVLLVSPSVIAATAHPSRLDG